MKKIKDINMIDITDKPASKRTAIARGTIFLNKETIEKIKQNKIKKGDPITVSEIAAISAIKNTPQILPLCHQIPITNINFNHELNDDRITIEVKVQTTAKTGVEMEALIGVSVFLNNIWDMTKYLEKDENGQYPLTKIENIYVVNKEKIILK